MIYWAKGRLQYTLLTIKQLLKLTFLPEFMTTGATALSRKNSFTPNLFSWMCHLCNKPTQQETPELWNNLSCSLLKRVIVQSWRRWLYERSWKETWTGKRSVPCKENSHILRVKLHDFVDQGHLIRDVVVVEEVWPAVALLVVPNLS